MDHQRLIRFDAISFEAFTSRRLVIQLADVQDPAVRQIVTRANCQDAAARLRSDDCGTVSFSEGGNKDLGSAGSAFASQDDEWNTYRSGFSCKTGNDGKTCAGAVGELAQIHSGSKKR